MTKTKFVGFRATEQQETKLLYLATVLGTNPSAVLRELVENAELKPVKVSPVAFLSAKNNGCGATFSPEHTTTVGA